MGTERVAALLALLWAVSVTPAARAQDDGDTRAQAARLFKAAAGDFAANRYDVAAREFEASHRLVPRAAAIYDAARAWDASGTVDRAADDYEEALEHTDLHGPDADDARHRLAQIRPTVALVSLQAPPDAHVWIGHVAGALGSVRTHLVPGDYVARAERPGDLPWSQTFHATAGADLSIAVTFVPEPAPQQPESPQAAGARRPRDRTWQWIALGVAAAGAIASGALYAVTIHARDQYDASNDTSSHLHDVAVGWRTATYAAYGVTALAAAAGVTLAFVW